MPIHFIHKVEDAIHVPTDQELNGKVVQLQAEIDQSTQEAARDFANLFDGSLAYWHGYEALPVLVQRLMLPMCLYSHSWAAACRLYLKNNEPTLSIFTCHPQLPYNGTKHALVWIIMQTASWGVACWLACIQNINLRTVLGVTVVSLCMSLLDIVLVKLAKCARFTTKARWLRYFCECLGYFTILWMGFLAASIAAGGSVTLAVLGNQGAPVASFGEVALDFVYSLLQKIFLLNPLGEIVVFQKQRHYYMKPKEGTKPCNVPILYPGFGEEGRVVWNRYIGADKTFDDLPPKAPTYAYTIQPLGLFTLYSYTPQAETTTTASPPPDAI